MIAADQIAIIVALAEGRDPFTGQAIPPEGLLNDARVARALLYAAQKLKPEPAPPSPRPGNIGARWDAVQEAELLGLFDSGVAVQDIARAMKRNSGGIRARLIRLGRLEKTT